MKEWRGNSGRRAGPAEVREASDFGLDDGYARRADTGDQVTVQEFELIRPWREETSD